MTTVVSVRGRKPAEWLADPRHVYVGRAMGRVGWRGSFWGNPYRRRAGDDQAAVWALVDAYARELAGLLDQRIADPRFVRLEGRELLHNARAVAAQSGLPELRGKVLGCWCGDWRPGQPDIPCHAVVLAKLADTWEPGRDPS